MRIYLLHGAILLGACGSTHADQEPIGGNVDTEAELQRFLRRAYIDLSGAVPDDATLATGTTRLREQGNTAAARGQLVDELIADDRFATVWVEDLETTIFGGNSLDQQYSFVCNIIRGDNDACESCTEADACSCSCPLLATLGAERATLRTAAADLRAGTTSSAIERRYAMAVGYYAIIGAPEARVTSLFDDFLARTAEPDEIENGRSMIFGAIFPGSPAGLMFHRHGANYVDLIDIVFDSEVYREAMVRRVFERYLARGPRPNELAYFLSTLDANDPDARPLVRAVVSSREYFEP
ncbi:MAG TPA: hypothetical protein VIU61_10300 [Kofleriaceae bacterium]